jgi:hypothetical protein
MRLRGLENLLSAVDMCEVLYAAFVICFLS